jgi:uncharacterized protein DUF3800
LTKRSELATRVSDVEYMQYVLLIDLTFMALQKSLIWFIEPDWALDLREFRFIYDGKLPRKLGAGEKLLLIFEHALEFKDSKDEPGLQIADTVANVVRRAVLDPEDAQARFAYNLVRPKLRYRDGVALHPVRLDTKNVAGGAGERYRGLHWA